MINRSTGHSKWQPTNHWLSKKHYVYTVSLSSTIQALFLYPFLILQDHQLDLLLYRYLHLTITPHRLYAPTSSSSPPPPPPV
jgi:hypothetical protein